MKGGYFMREALQKQFEHSDKYTSIGISPDVIATLDPAYYDLLVIDRTEADDRVLSAGLKALRGQ